MRPNFRHSNTNTPAWGLAFWLLLLVAAWPVQGLEGGAVSSPPRGEGKVDNPSRGWARVTVDQGRLSVEAREADIHMVLARIAAQAGIIIRSGPLDQRIISVAFTDVDLEQGLRRLLRLASLNHVILYTQGPAGGVAIQEVRIFVEAPGETPLQPIVAEGTAEESVVTEQDVKEGAQDAAQRFTTALTQALGASPSPTGGEENDVARRFREALGGAQEGTPPASEGMESEAARRFREVLQLQLQQ